MTSSQKENKEIKKEKREGEDESGKPETQSKDSSKNMSLKFFISLLTFDLIYKKHQRKEERG